jgi:hypothetical protein
MKQRLPYIGLLIVCLVVILLELSGGYAANVNAVHTVKAGTLFMITPPLGMSVSVLSLVAMIYGVILAILHKQWKWMVLLLLTSYIGAIVYTVFSLIRLGKRVEGPLEMIGSYTNENPTELI